MTPTPARPALDALVLADELERLRDAAVAGEYNPSKMVALQMKAAFNIDTIISSLRSLADMRGACERLAIVQRVRLAYQGGTIPVGYLCKLCEAECDLGEDVTHAPSCALARSAP